MSGLGRLMFITSHNLLKDVTAKSIKPDKYIVMQITAKYNSITYWMLSVHL